MGVNEGNIQVMGGCRNKRYHNGKLFNTYSDGTHLQIAIHCGVQIWEILPFHLSIRSMLSVFPTIYILHV